MRLTLRQIQVFAAIAKAGNVTHAANALAMSQSAASSALAELERQMGHPLFDRIGMRLKLNETGRAAMPSALEMLERANALETLLSGKAGPGPLRLGASLTIGNYVAPALIEPYVQLHPEAKVKLEIGNTSRIAERVASLDLDLALVEGEVSGADLISTAWSGDRLAIFCSPSHPLARTRKATIDKLLNESWVVREPGSGTRQTLDRAMTPYWPRWKIAVELEHTEAIKSTVAASRTIGCVSDLALGDSLKAGSLVEIEAPELVLARAFYIIQNREKYRTQAMEVFVGALVGDDTVG